MNKEIYNDMEERFSDLIDSGKNATEIERVIKEMGRELKQIYGFSVLRDSYDILITILQSYMLSDLEEGTEEYEIAKKVILPILKMLRKKSKKSTRKRSGKK